MRRLIPVAITVGLSFAAPLGAQGVEAAAVDTAAARWMRDTVTKDLAARPGMTVDAPRFRRDTAWLAASRTTITAPDRDHTITIEYRFERRGGTWVLLPTRMIMLSQGRRTTP